MRKLSILLLALLATSSLWADCNILESGTCGDSLSWVLCEGGELTISGSGSMFDYDNTESPWKNKWVQRVTIEEGVTRIGNHAFLACSTIEFVSMGTTVTSIGEAAFEQCSALLYASLSPNLQIIESGAFQGDSLLTEVILPNSVTTVGGYAFSQCSGLQYPIYNNKLFAKVPLSETGHFYVPEGITTICSTAFDMSHITGVTFPQSLTTIENMAFSYCYQLDSVIIGPNVQTIDWNAFYYCTNLKHVELGASVTNTLIGNPFDFCEKIEAFIVDNNNPRYCAVDGVIFSKDKSELVLYPVGKKGRYEIPSSTTSIRKTAFYGCQKVDTIIVPSSITKINNRAFSYCVGLKAIELPNTLTLIDTTAFGQCHYLRSITCFANTPPRMASQTFWLVSNLDSIQVYVPAVSVEAYKTAYGWNELKNINAIETEQKESIITYKASEKLVEVTENLAGIHIHAFSVPIKSHEFNDSIGVITFDGQLDSINNQAFSGCTTLISITIPEGVKRIGDLAFCECYALRGIELPETLNKIGTYAFNECRSLKSIYIPNNVKSIGTQSFYNCYSLKTTNLPTRLIYIEGGTFYGCRSLDSIVIPNEVLEISSQAFLGCSSLKSVRIGNNVTIIGNEAFNGCSTLTSIHIPGSVSSIGKNVFRNCSSLTSFEVDPSNVHYASVNGALLNYNQDTLFMYPAKNSQTEYIIPNSVTTIVEFAFRGCKTLTSLVMGDNVAKIEHCAFSGCSSITSLTIPINMKSIEKGALDGLDSLKEVIWNAKNCNLGTYFNNTIENLTFGDSVEVIPRNICSNLIKLTTIKIPQNVKSIGNWAFSNCTSLLSITSSAVIPPTCESYTFYNVDKSIPLYVPARSVTAYRTTNGWKEFTNILPIAEPDSLSGQCGDSLTWGIKDSVLTISGTGEMTSAPWNEYADAIKYIFIKDDITSLTDSAFYASYPNLKSFTCEAETPPTGAPWCLSGIRTGIPIFITESSMEAYRNAGYWKLLTNLFPIGQCSYSIICGTCGENLTWSLNLENGVLDIVGEGEMIDFGGGNAGYSERGMPWGSVKQFIKTATIGEGITSVGNGAFLSSSNLKHVTLPSTLTRIGELAFNWSPNLQDVILPYGLKYIEQQAFEGCTSLNNIIIPSTVDSIAGSAFSGCTNVTHVVLPDSVAFIGDGIFRFDQAIDSQWVYNSHTFAYLSENWMGAFSVPEGITKIAGGAMMGCKNLTELTLPKSLQTIEVGAFMDCSSLDSLVIPENVRFMASDAFFNLNNMQYIRMKSVIPPVIMEYTFEGFEDSFTFYVPNGTATDYKKSAYWNRFNFIEYGNEECIADSGKCGDNLTWKLSCDSVLTISGTGAMYDFNNSLCNPSSPWHKCTLINSTIKKVIVEVGVTTIGDMAFSYCTNLESVSLPEGLQRIGRYAFNSSQFISITLPQSLKSIDEFAFEWCDKLTDMVIPDSVASIGRNAFSACQAMTQCHLGVGLQSVDFVAFQGCTSLTNIHIPSNVSYIGNSLFAMDSSLVAITVAEDNEYYCSVDGVLFSKDTTILVDYPGGKGVTYTMPQAVKEIQYGAFAENVKLQEVIYSDSLTIIGDYAFSGNRELRIVSLPDNVKRIGQWAYANCMKMDSMRIGGGVQEIGESAISNFAEMRIIDCYLPAPITLYENAMEYTPSSCLLVVNPGSYSQWASAPEWNKLTIVERQQPFDCQDYRFVQDTTLCWGDTTLYWRGQWSYRSYDNYQTWTRNSEYSTRYYEDIDTLVDYHYTINGCDSVYYLAVHYKGAYISVRYDTIQQGETHWSGNSQTGIYYNHVYDIQGCDSIIYEIHLYVQPIQYHTITTAVNNTKYGSVEGAGTYLAGDTVILTATPKKGYQFTQWSDGNTDNPRHVAVTKDATYTAQFAIKQCSWLVESSDLEMGAVYTDFTNEYYNYGTQITVEASPNSGYKFVKWNDGKKYNPYKFSILEDKYLLAIFMADEEEMDTTTVQPADTTATFQWPFIEGGYTYTLTIYADQNYTKPICTLTFNQYGQLVSINFMYGAPTRHGTGTQPETFVCTVNGLEAGQEYFYKMETTDEDGRLLNTDEGGFTTTQGGTPTTLKEMHGSQKSKVGSQKIMLDGQLYILRDGKTYNAQGTEVK